MPPFVKAADTTVPVEKSQQDIIKILGRYGARDFGFDDDPETRVATVRFKVKASQGMIPVELKVHVDLVHKAMYEGKEPREWRRATEIRARWREQSKRTAWRLLVDWLDAALSTTSMGVQTVEEVFLAHVVLETVDGKRGRVIDYVQTAMVAGGGLPALPATTEER